MLTGGGGAHARPVTPTGADAGKTPARRSLGAPRARPGRSFVNRPSAERVWTGEMKRESEDELDSLLAEGRLSGPARDRIFEASLPPQRPGWRRVLVWALPLSTVAALLLFMLRPSEFRARGGGGPLLEVGCSNEVCR